MNITANNQVGAVAFLVVLLVVLGIIVYLGTRPQKPKPAPAIPAIKQQYSFPAKQLQVMYHNLPAAHKPDYDINAVVQALDTKHGISKVDYHFAPDGTRYHQSFTDHRCRVNGTTHCPYADYICLRNSMEVLINAHKEYEHALQVAAQQHGFDEMQRLIESLQGETRILVENRKNVESEAPSA